MSEKPKSMQEIILEQYRVVPVADIEYEVLEERLTDLFGELPNLKLAYTSYILQHHKTSDELSSNEFQMLCQHIGLRHDPFYLTNDEYAENRAHIIEVARERSSHDTYKDT